MLEFDPAAHAQVHPVLFRLKPTVDAAALKQKVTEFNALNGVAASLAPFSGPELLKQVFWPDKTQGYNWCLTVVAKNENALKAYLHSPQHAAWAKLVGPHVDAAAGPPLLVFDCPLSLTAEPHASCF